MNLMMHIQYSWTHGQSVSHCFEERWSTQGPPQPKQCCSWQWRLRWTSQNIAESRCSDTASSPWRKEQSFKSRTHQPYHKNNNKTDEVSGRFTVYSNVNYKCTTPDWLVITVCINQVVAAIFNNFRYGRCPVSTFFFTLGEVTLYLCKEVWY